MQGTWISSPFCKYENSENIYQLLEAVRYKIVTIINTRTTWKLKDRGVNIEKKLQILRRGEGSEELFFLKGAIVNHVHEFTEITGTLKILKNWLIKVWTIIKTYTPYIQSIEIKKCPLWHTFPLKLKWEICFFFNKKSP